ncbi:Glu/Leu/Phe/Val dehydrogenase [Patescibacteria group bacterium]|nr:Glu/Leu/Phe/Val dehydrogenase [Patescibacteria group bacterium]
MTNSSSSNTYKNIQGAIRRAGEDLGFSESTITTITNPYNVINESVMVEGIDTPINMYRVQFNNALGPYKGGIRFHPDVDLDEVKTLAITMMLKCSLVGIPMGGAKGGATLNPEDYTETEIEAVARAWVRTMHEYIGVDKDIPAPDVNTNGQIMSYMLDEFEHIVGRSEPGMITGKPIALGGSLGREQATSQGGVYALLKMIEYFPEKVGKKRVVIQGFGNVGSFAATLLAEEGFTIVGISDSRGAVYSGSGLEVHMVAEKKKTSNQSLHEMFDDHDDVLKISNEELLLQDCDILIPAALENQITEANAKDIQAHIILELANNPTSQTADDILKERGVLVIPDFLANAGGVTVSYFEWVQNRAQYYWTAKEVDEKLFQFMVDATDRVYTLSQKESLTLREAGFRLAVERVGRALELRGQK